MVFSAVRSDSASWETVRTKRHDVRGALALFAVICIQCLRNSGICVCPLHVAAVLFAVLRSIEALRAHQVTSCIVLVKYPREQYRLRYFEHHDYSPRTYRGEIVP